MRHNIILISILLMIAQIANAGGSMTNTYIEPLLPMQDIKIEYEDDTKYFVYVAGGISSIELDANPASPAQYRDGALDEQGTLIELAVGYRYDEDIFFTLAVQNIGLDISDIYNFYGSVNYQLSDTILSPYIGIGTGYSLLEWSTEPHVTFLNKDLTSDAFMLSAQAGIEYRIIDNLSVSLRYQYLVHDHVTNIQDNSKKINHKNSQNLLGGVRYGF